MCSSTINQDLKSIFMKSIEAVHPPKLIKKHVYLKGNKLHVYNHEYKVNKNCYIVGFGKAVYEMSLELEKTLGEHLVRGCVSIPPGMTNPERKSTRVDYLEGAANNLPDVDAELAAKQIANLVKTLIKSDVLFVLISGGGSALLPAPVPSIPLADKTKLIKMLANNGASIIELNCVRKKLSTLKGGGLACLAYPATLISLILSDVIGDPLDFIASGPTVPNTDETSKVKEIILKYANTKVLPQSILDFLEVSETPPEPETIEIIDGNYEHVTNYLIGNNVLALSAAGDYATSLGYDTLVLSNSVSGDVEKISRAYSSIALEIYLHLNKSSTNNKTKVKDTLMKYKDTLKISDDKIKQMLVKLKSKRKKCLIFGGEPTVQVKGDGKGGRNQHLALLFSSHLDECNVGTSTPMNISFLSGGTDGIDGPTDAAGAISFNGLTNISDLNVQEYLDRYDSYNFFRLFSNGQYLIKTGHTGTNVMDVHLIMINIF